MNIDTDKLQPFFENRVEARLAKFAVSSSLGFPLLLGGNVHAVIDADASRLVHTLIHYVYGFDNPESPAARVVEWSASFQVPASWWDAFKLHFALRWWMRWWLKKHPVKHRTLSKDFKETITARALLPDVPICDSYRTHYVMTGGRPLAEGRKCQYCKGEGYTIDRDWMFR
jgi:hypothetical protein